MEQFIENFKNQLEDIDTGLTSETDYVNSDFWDSLTSVTIQMMIEDEYGMKIDIKTLSSFSTIKELYSFILNQK